MRKKGIKLLGITLMFVLMFNIISMNYARCYATPGSSFSQEQFDGGGAGGGTGNGGSANGMVDVSQNVEYWKPIPEIGGDDFDAKVSVIATIVRNVGIFASVIALSIIGIKFMLGSVEEKAQYKHTLIPWLIGAILVFAMTNIPVIIYEFTRGIFN